MIKKIAVILVLSVILYCVRFSQFSLSDFVVAKLADKLSNHDGLIKGVSHHMSDGYRSPYGPGQDAWKKFLSEKK